jgi:phenylpyruvate tautomerase PptA (4-oxalocrotonate tautomerase family)
MQETIIFPSDVLFHKIHEMKKEQMIYLAEFRNVQRSENMIYLECTIKAARNAEQKQMMYQHISNDLFSKLGVRKEDLIIIVRENSSEDWYLNPKS